ncbi:TadE family type IV pilus minor pilin [Bifidobacterium platyrrhinorum]|uniref:Pilus assembly protein n=1 Tax=Bifidobacterium platyrrhinorum TaxID=2661628 RepID=A0A6L9STI5_9BIFI|nr:TadE family type IV pilus minor pilin [Bifidobacterium platyrrhinorum]NEG55335.1 pilus assembly protein [Bifidobacterium platyrrhinorum]
MIAAYARRRARRPPAGTERSVLRERSASAADPGTVTAEFATVLPAVVAMALLLLALARMVMVSIGCQDAASAAARAAVAAQASDSDAAKAAASVVNGASVELSRAGDRVTVVTQCPVIPDPLGVLPTVVRGRAVGVMS